MNEPGTDESPAAAGDDVDGTGRGGPAPGSREFDGAGPTASAGGRPLVNLSSDDLLGLSRNERCVTAAGRALEERGSGAAPPRDGVALWDPHRELEDRLARFFDAPEVSLAPSGHDATALGVAALLGGRGVVVADGKVGPAARVGAALAGASWRAFEHRDVDHAAAAVRESLEDGAEVLLVTEGVFAGSGSVAPLPELVGIAEELGVPLLVDDAWGLGLLGAAGRGTVDHFDLSAGAVELWTGSLAKALGGHGGFFAGEPGTIERIRRRSPGLWTWAGPPAPATAAAAAAIGVLQDNPAAVEQLWENAGELRQRLEGAGFDFGVSETPILSLTVEDVEGARELAGRLFDGGLLVRVVAAAEEGGARLRLTVRADHESEHLERAARVLQQEASTLIE